MNGIWNDLGQAESAALAASGGANALYFARRVLRGVGARRISAAVLVGLFAGVGLEGAAHLGGNAGTAAEVLVRAPLLLATLATNVVLAIGARR